MHRIQGTCLCFRVPLEFTLARLVSICAAEDASAGHIFLKHRSRATEAHMSGKNRQIIGGKLWGPARA